MKRTIKLLMTILSVTAAIFAFCSCADVKETDIAKPSIICTAFPQYDWVREIAGDRAQEYDIVLLNDNGVDMHSYQPSVDDIVKIGECDILISVGSPSEKWLDDALANSENEKTVHIKLVDAIGEGKLLGNDGHICNDEHEHEHSSETDEHVWLSLENAKSVCGVIAGELSAKDPENAEYYAERLKIYTDKLNSLISELSESVENSRNKTLIFTDRFPFRYFLNDFQIEYYAAFEGCSSDSEASFETVAFLAEKLDELELSYVITVDGSDGKLAKTVISNTESKDQEILKLDSMQSVNRDDIENGISYIAVMEKNIDTVITALN